MGKRYCCVASCPSRYQTGNHLSLFLPPKDPRLFSKWKHAMNGYKKGPLARYNSICELHFKPEQILRDYITKVACGTIHRMPRAKVTLKRGACPSVFQQDFDKRMELTADTYNQMGSEVTFIIESSDSDNIQSEEIEDPNLCGADSSERVMKMTPKSPLSCQINGEPSRSTVFTNQPSERRTNNFSKLDIRTILSSKTDKSPFNEESFNRFCRAHIVSNVAKTGRPSKFSQEESELNLNESGKFGEEFIVYPTIGHLDVFTLIHNIEMIGFPSDNWFCTLKDGAPTFLCWANDFKIRKKVIFNAKNLDPKIIVDDEEIVLSEVIRPRSLKEVNSILLLVDSLRTCPQKDSLSNNWCKGYYFQNDEDIELCSNCLDASALSDTERHRQSYSFDLICQYADDIIATFHNWSYTLIGKVLVFISWGESYSIDKTMIIDQELSVKVMFGDVYVNMEDIPLPRTIEDVRSFIEYLEMCRSCSGIDNTRRSKGCKGYVSRRRQRIRMTRCRVCAETKKMAAKTYISTRSLLESQLHPKRLKNIDPDSSIQNFQCSPLEDILPHVTLPNGSWSYTILGEAAVFQNWEADFTVVKRIVVHSNFSLLIFLDDNIVKIADMQSVSSADELTAVIHMVDCIELCEGFDDLCKKAIGCPGFTFDEQQNGVKLRRCNYCLTEFTKLHGCTRDNREET